MSIKIKVTDVPVQIPIDINDSCHCFSMCCNRSTKVYITKSFVAEKFDVNKSVDKELDRKTSFERIHWLFNKYDAESMLQASIIYEDKGDFLTTRDIKRINAMLSEASDTSSSITSAKDESL